MRNDLFEKWKKKIVPALVGRTIIGVRLLTDEERAAVGWLGSPVVLVLDDGNVLYASADDEGNGPGALFTTCKGLSTMPVMP